MEKDRHNTWIFVLMLTMLVGTNACLSALKGRQKVPTRTVSVTCPAFSPQQNADDLYEDQGYVADTEADADADGGSAERLQTSPKGQSCIFPSVPLAEDNISHLIGVFSPTDK